MSIHSQFYSGQRLSYDGALCTVRCKVDNIPGTKGEWLGVEWDDQRRGKHNGTYNGTTYFQCSSSIPTAASFIRPTRRADSERTVLEAIKHKYVSDQSLLAKRDTVIISGKIAEEVGFDKIIKEQSMLANLKVAILDHMAISGISPRGASSADIRLAQEELRRTCPEVTELDLSHNPIENWSDVENFCVALPNLRTLKLNSARLRAIDDSAYDIAKGCFLKLRELHLNECLINLSETVQILQTHERPRFPVLQNLWLSQNELADLSISGFSISNTFDSVETVVLENNLFTSLDSLVSWLSIFPNVGHISLQSNKISSYGNALGASEQMYLALHNLNLAQNEIDSFSFIDHLPQTFPNLSSLRISKNPVYKQANLPGSSTKPTDTSYYLTLARIPNLKTLNYTDITPREREEGEIYYLSIAEKDIRSTLSSSLNQEAAIQILLSQYPRYTPLCKKHDRDDLIKQLTAPASGDTSALSNFQDKPQQVYPPGTLASRLVQTTFYVSNPDHAQPLKFSRNIPNTIATSSIFALVTRELYLQPLTFKLVYESEELDPVRDDLTTRSQIYADRSKGSKRWDDWGDWDADELVERSIREQERGSAGDVETSGSVDDGKWIEGDVLVKDGRKWRKREVEILFGTKKWGDWLEKDVKMCRIRVEIVEKRKMK